MFWFYVLLAFLIFFLQNFLPSMIRFDLLTLFIVFVTIQGNFIIAVTLSLTLGIALDCYGTAPLGLQAGMLLIAVLGVEILRRHLNFQYIFPQLIGVAAITVMQSVAMALFLHLLMPVPVLYPAFVHQKLLHIGATIIAAPIILTLLFLLENLWRRWLLIKV
jgi:rod shape-determining protein MreD